MPHADIWQEIRGAPRDRVLRLLVQGRVRFGFYDHDANRWRSTIDDDVILRPTHWREMPSYALPR